MDARTVRGWLAKAGDPPELQGSASQWTQALELAQAKLASKITSGKRTAVQLATVAGIAERNLTNLGKAQPEPAAPDWGQQLDAWVTATYPPDLRPLAHKAIERQLSDELHEISDGTRLRARPNAGGSVTRRPTPNCSTASVPSSRASRTSWRGMRRGRWPTGSDGRSERRRQPPTWPVTTRSGCGSGGASRTPAGALPSASPRPGSRWSLTPTSWPCSTGPRRTYRNPLMFECVPHHPIRAMAERRCRRPSGSRADLSSWSAFCRRTPTCQPGPQPPARGDASPDVRDGNAGARARPRLRRWERGCEGSSARRIRLLAFAWPSPLDHGTGSRRSSRDVGSCLGRIVLSAARRPLEAAA